LQRQLGESRADASALRDHARSREQALEACQSDQEESLARVAQLESMLDAVKKRVASREAEWEGKQREWERRHRGESCAAGSTAATAAQAPTTAAAAPSSPSAALASLREELASERAKHAAARAAQEADWHASQSARDQQEQSLQSAAIRAKQAHASVLREYEELRQENSRVQAAVDADKQEMEARLRKSNTALADARNVRRSRRSSSARTNRR